MAHGFNDNKTKAEVEPKGGYYSKIKHAYVQKSILMDNDEYDSITYSDPNGDTIVAVLGVTHFTVAPSSGAYPLDVLEIGANVNNEDNTAISTSIHLISHRTITPTSDTFAVSYSMEFTYLVE